jgi:hypothetical protein
MHPLSGYQINHKDCAVFRWRNHPAPVKDTAGKPGISIVFGIDDSGLEIYSPYQRLGVSGPQKWTTNHRLVLFINGYGRVCPCSPHSGPPLRMAVVTTGTGIANYVLTILTDRHSQRIGMTMRGYG